MLELPQDERERPIARCFQIAEAPRVRKGSASDERHFVTGSLESWIHTVAGPPYRPSTWNTGFLLSETGPPKATTAGPALDLGRSEGRHCNAVRQNSWTSELAAGGRFRLIIALSTESIGLPASSANAIRSSQ